MNLPVAFGLVVPSEYGSVLVNRYDTNQTRALVQSGRSLNHEQIRVLCGFLQSAPERAVALDVGANFGLYSLGFARTLAAKHGRVMAFEAQRMLAYLVSGTAALNGLENLFVFHQAVGAAPGRIPIPRFDYNKVSSFGSVEFGAPQKEFIGQPVDEQPENPEQVEVVRLDDLDVQGVHLAKIDIEGMEEAALDGAEKLIERDKPLLCVEWIKSDRPKLVERCKAFGYHVYHWGGDLLCVHRDRKDQYGVSIHVPEL